MKQTYAYSYNSSYAQTDRREWVNGVEQAKTVSSFGPFGDLRKVEDSDPQSGAGIQFGPHAATFAYDLSGALVSSERSYNGLTDNSTKTEFVYDGAGRLSLISHSGKPLGPIERESLVSFGYGYDAAGRINNIAANWNHTIPGLARLTDTHTFSYDAAGQLISYSGVTDSGPGNGVTSGAYAYGANGNRVGVTTETGGGSDTYVAALENRIQRDSTYSYTYDAEGNLTERRLLAGNVLDQRFTWDHRNRLVGVELYASGQLAETIEYRYDAAGDLVYRSADPVGSPSAAVEHYVVNTGQRMMTLDGANKASHRYQYGVTGELLFDQVFSSVGQQTDLKLPLGDHQNSTRIVLDGDDLSNPMSVRQTIDYAAFGRVAKIRDAAAQPLVNGAGEPNLAALDTVFGYDGEAIDRETGLVEMGARWYSPDMGRFLSEDPSQDDVNWYEFAGNDPVNYADPTGLSQAGYPLGGNTTLGLGPYLGSFGVPTASSKAFQQVGNSNTFLGPVQSAASARVLNELRPIVAANQATAMNRQFAQITPFLQDRLPQAAPPSYDDSAAYRGAADLATSLTPYVSDARDVYEVVTGRDAISGQRLTGIQYGLTLLGAALPVVGGAFFRKAAGTADAVHEVSHAADAARLEREVEAATAPSKFVPNPNGRIGNAATQAKTQEIISDLRARGFTSIRTEAPFQPGSFGSGHTRYADVVGRNPVTGESEIIQIGRTTTSDPRVPVMRERQALDDIIFSPTIQNFPNSTIRFIDVNRPGVIQP